jgi:hypothetical protein
VMRGGCKGSAASEVWSGGAEDFRPGSADMVGKTGLTRGTHASADDGEKALRRNV